METRNVLASINERLKSPEYRREYGAQLIKYDLAETLVDARKSKGYSQRVLADLMGVSQAYIAKLESGRANTTIGLVGALLAFLDMRAQFSLRPLSASAEVAEQTMLFPTHEFRANWARAREHSTAPGTLLQLETTGHSEVSSFLEQATALIAAPLWIPRPPLVKPRNRLEPDTTMEMCTTPAEISTLQEERGLALVA